MNLTQLLGRSGERVAARFLKKSCRHRILAKNYKCPAGEVDLITAHLDTIVFVEVKTRSADGPSKPFEAVGIPKQRTLERVARYFLLTHELQNKPCRFDVVSITWPPNGKPKIEHFEDAFQAKF